MTITKYTMLNFDKSKCRKEQFHQIKVKVFHSFSGKKTWQTWKLCKEHYVNFIKNNGKGYAVIYKKKPDAIVIDYKLQEGI